MKQLYFLDEEEKNRILNLHESATKRQYLSEQAAPSEWLPDPTKNPNWEYQFKDNSWFARKKGTTKEYNISQNKKYASSVNHLNTAYPNGKQTQVKQNTNTDPSKAAQETAKVAQTVVVPAGIASGTNTSTGTAAGTNTSTGTAAGTNTSTGTVAGTKAGSGVVSVNANDIIATSETGTETPAVAGTPAAEPTTQFKAQTLPDFKGYTAPKSE